MRSRISRPAEKAKLAATEARKEAEKARREVEEASKERGNNYPPTEAESWRPLRPPHHHADDTQSGGSWSDGEDYTESVSLTSRMDPPCGYGRASTVKMLANKVRKILPEYTDWPDD